MKLVYTWAPADFDLLRLSLRSVCANTKAPDVHLVSEFDPPEWLDGVKYHRVPNPPVDAHKCERINLALHHFCEKFPDEKIVVVNADHVVLRENWLSWVGGAVCLERDDGGPMKANIDPFVTLLQDTVSYLRHNGLPADNFCTHTPYRLDTNETVAHFKRHGHHYHLETMLFNKAAAALGVRPLVIEETSSFRTSFLEQTSDVEGLKYTTFASVDQNGYTMKAAAALSARFPTPCKFERL